MLAGNGVSQAGREGVHNSLLTFRCSSHAPCDAAGHGLPSEGQRIRRPASCSCRSSTRNTNRNRQTTTRHTKNKRGHRPQVTNARDKQKPNAPNSDVVHKSHDARYEAALWRPIEDQIHFTCEEDQINLFNSEDNPRLENWAIKKLDPFHSRVKKIRPISCVKNIRLPYSIVKTL